MERISFYHNECVNEEMRTSLQLPNEPDVSYDDQLQTLEYRGQLWDEINQIRLDALDEAYGKGIDNPYWVYGEEAVDDITLKCPLTAMDLMKCFDIKKKRCSMYGGDILAASRRWATEGRQQQAMPEAVPSVVLSLSVPMDTHISEESKEQEEKEEEKEEAEVGVKMEE